MNYERIKIIGQRIRKYLINYSEISTIHGLRYLVEKRTKAEKIIWLIVLILSLTGCVYMINSIWIKYQNNPIVINFATKTTPIYEIPFPAVTICPEQKFETNTLNYSGLYYKILNREDTTRDESKNFHYFSMLCQSRENEPTTLKSIKFLEDDFFEIVEKSKPAFDPKVYFMENMYQNILFPVITDEGICYSFNILDRSEIFRDEVIHYRKFYVTHNYTGVYDIESGFNKNSGIDAYPFRAHLSGANNDLRIFLNNDDINDDYLCNPFFEGFRVVLHNSYDVPSASKHYISVPLEHMVMVAIQPDLVKTSDEIKKYRPEIRKCYLKDERILMYFKIYTQSNCRLECQTNYTLTTCGCASFYMPRKSGTKICGQGSYRCSKRAERQMLTEELETKISGKTKTKCDCLPLCTDLSFNVETSTNNFNWDWVEHNNNESDFKDSRSLLRIYFKREEFMTLERTEIYGISDLISNFGGLLGLFVGFSLLSLVEIIYFLTVRIYCSSRNDMKKSIKTQAVTSCH